MTRSCCPTCRLRFSRATAAQLGRCPFCGQPSRDASAAEVLGFRLMAIDPLVAPDATAVAVALAKPRAPEHDHRA